MHGKLCLLALMCAVFAIADANKCEIPKSGKVERCDSQGDGNPFYCKMKFHCCHVYLGKGKGLCFKPLREVDRENSVGAAGRLRPGSVQNRPNIKLTTARVQYSRDCLFHCTSVEKPRRLACRIGGPIDMYACLNSGCCYDATDSMVERRCYFPLASSQDCPSERCQAPSGSLTRCNAYTEQTCQASGCCWRQVDNQNVCYAQENPPTVLLSSSNFVAGPVIQLPTTPAPSTTARSTTTTPVPTTTKEMKFLDLLVQRGGVLEEYSVVDLLSKSISQLLRKRNRTVTTTTPRPTTTATTTTTIATTTRQPRTFTTLPPYIFRRVCSWFSGCREIKQPNPDIKKCYPTDCGRPVYYPGSPKVLPQSQSQSPTSLKKIVGGSTAYPFSHPWTVMILKTEGKRTHLCSGSVICKRWIVTAAHCFNRQSEKSPIPDLDAIFYTVYVGRYMGKDYTPGSQVQVFHGRDDIDFIELHENFRTGVSRGVVGYDVAVMRLKKDIVFDDFAQPICMPTKRAEVDQVVWATGWGETKRLGPSNQNLKQLGVKILNETTCNKEIPKFVDNPPPGVLCAGGEEKQDTCTGDSGGPLAGPIPVVESRRRVIRWQLFGLTSFGSPSCNTFPFDRQPAVYTDIHYYKDWINQRTNYCCD